MRLSQSQVETMKAILLAAMMAAITLTGCLSDEPAPLQPESDEGEEIPADGAPSDADPMQIFDSYEDRPAGVERQMRFLYPFPLPPGQDLNRITLDLRVHGGFLVAVSPTLFYADTGTTPSNQEMHIHHAHWFRTSSDPEDEYYTANLAWVFGTGEERTSGSFHDRADVQPDGPRYGIYIAPEDPQVLIYMIHNKLSEAAMMYVALDVRFVYGTAEEIATADGCPELMEGEVCRAGDDFHHLNGKLWGTTFDVPREPMADGHDGQYIHPIDIAEDWETRRATDDLGRFYTTAHSGTAIASAGHMHPNGKEVIVANLGPEGSGCEADIDGDGYPGVTLLRSHKIEQVPEAFPHSEEYQMGATQNGWRAPIREGDRITQYAVYANDDFASYAAMSFVGLYVDRQQVPEPRGSEGCTAENTGAYLLDDGAGDPTAGVANRGWSYEAPMHCGIHIGWPACDKELPSIPTGLDSANVGNVIHIADFLYLPGDQSLAGDLGAPVRVQQGETITFVNEDAAGLIRHTVTSCKFPCNGKYVANYPQPDGDFHSGKLGNVDPIDGGGIDPGSLDPSDPLGLEVASDTLPVWQLDTSDLEAGYYAYYCLIHPWMRGWIEIVE